MDAKSKGEEITVFFCKEKNKECRDADEYYLLIQFWETDFLIQQLFFGIFHEPVQDGPFLYQP